MNDFYLHRAVLQAHPARYKYSGLVTGVPACGAEAEVRVRVWAGGAAPAWDRAHYTVTSREDAPPATPLAPALRARSPLHRQLIYTLRDDDRGLFEIHFDTGECRALPCRDSFASPKRY